MDQEKVLDLVRALSNDECRIVSQGNSAHVALYGTTIRLVCQNRASTVELTPIAIRLGYNRPPTRLRSNDNPIQSLSIVCSTRNHIEPVIGSASYTSGLGFELYGRLRRSRTDRPFRNCTGSRYVVLTVTSLERTKITVVKPSA